MTKGIRKVKGSGLTVTLKNETIESIIRNDGMRVRKVTRPDTIVDVKRVPVSTCHNEDVKRVRQALWIGGCGVLFCTLIHICAKTINNLNNNNNEK